MDIARPFYEIDGGNADVPGTLCAIQTYTKRHSFPTALDVDLRRNPVLSQVYRKSGEEFGLQHCHLNANPFWPFRPIQCVGRTQSIFTRSRKSGFMHDGTVDRDVRALMEKEGGYGAFHPIMCREVTGRLCSPSLTSQGTVRNQEIERLSKTSFNRDSSSVYGEDLDGAIVPLRRIIYMNKETILAALIVSGKAS